MLRQEETAENGNSWQRHRPFWLFSPPQCESAGQREHLVIRRRIIRPAETPLTEQIEREAEGKELGRMASESAATAKEDGVSACACGERYE